MFEQSRLQKQQDKQVIKNKRGWLTHYDELVFQEIDLNEMLKIAAHIAENPFHEIDFVTC